MADTLPPKEAALFRKIVKQYESKQYKQALRSAQTILSKPGLSEHAGTLAMKGLIYNGLDKREDAYDLVRQGLKSDISSSLCWHVYGIICRSDKNYEQAQKCYRQALARDSTNVQIYRDLATLQIQIRDIEGFKETRLQLLKEKSSQRTSWMGYAIAQHLTNDYIGAVTTLCEFIESQKGASHEFQGYDLSETCFYVIEILLESEEYDMAFEKLMQWDTKIVDRRGFHEIRAIVLQKLGKLEEASLVWYHLMLDNPEHRKYYQEYVASKQIADSEDQVLQFLDEISSKFPRAIMPQIIQLEFATGDNFTSRILAFLQSFLRKGVPPLFHTIRHLYRSESKAKTIERLINDFEKNLSQSNSFDQAGLTESPAVLAWVKHFKGQHLDYFGRYEDALKVISEAIEHTPTLIELYMAKAKILKHIGCHKEAAETLDYARSLDTADRYINSKCVKYQLRAGHIKEAEANAILFTRESGDPLQQFFSMQCSWFENEESQAFLNNNDIPNALARAHLVGDNFSRAVDEQFDFHSYCLRRTTLRAYVKLLKYEDRIHGHKHYVRAALFAAKLYLSLFERPYSKKGDQENEAAMAGMSEAEKKKYLSKLRKAQKKAEAEAQQQASQSKGKKPSDDLYKHTTEICRKSDDYAQTKTPLDDALRFLKPLLNIGAQDINVFITAFDVYAKQKKILLMQKMLHKAAAIDPTSNHLIARKAIFVTMVRDASDLPQAVQIILNEGNDQLSICGKDAQSILKSLENNVDDLASCLAYCHACSQLGLKSGEQCADLLLSSIQKNVRPSLQLLTEIGTFLNTNCPSVLAKFKVAGGKHWPNADIFKSN